MNSLTRDMFESKRGLNDLYKLLLRKEQFSNFIDRDILTQYVCFENEVKELKEYIEQGNSEEAIKELADVIYLLGTTVQKMLKIGFITKEQLSGVLSNHSEKIYKRSPQLIYGKKESYEREEELWKLGKNKTQLDLFTSLENKDESKAS